MPDIDLDLEMFPPVVYEWWWWLVLPLFIALLVAWIILSKRVARVRGWKRKLGPTQRVVTPVRRSNPRPWAMHQIQLVEDSVRSGELSVRDAHLELSEIVRELAWDLTGVDARTMTLTELRHSRLAVVADAVGSWYPIAFAPSEVEHADAAIARAREVVTRWS